MGKMKDIDIQMQESIAAYLRERKRKTEFLLSALREYQEKYDQSELIEQLIDQLDYEDSVLEEQLEAYK